MSRYDNDDDLPVRPFRRIETISQTGQPLPSHTGSFERWMPPPPSLPTMRPQADNYHNMDPPPLHYSSTPVTLVDGGRGRAYMPRSRRRYSADSNDHIPSTQTRDGSRDRDSSRRPQRPYRSTRTSRSRSRSLSPLPRWSGRRERTRTSSSVSEQVQIRTPPTARQEKDEYAREADEGRNRSTRRSRVAFESSGSVYGGDDTDNDDDDDDDDGDDGDDGDDDDDDGRVRIRQIRRSTSVSRYDGADDTAASTMYSFTPSNLSYAASAQNSSVFGDEEPPDKEEDSANSGGGDGTGAGAGAGGSINDAKPNTPRLLSQSYVFRSEYSGDHMMGGSHGAKLTAVVCSHLKRSPLFRWRHCTRSFMDFDEFSVEATRCLDLTVAELKGIRDLLARVQRKSVKSVQTAAGRSVRHMEPSCIQQEMPHDGSSKTASFTRRTVTWVCLPYFTLEKYSGLQGASGNRSAFPMETLLQSNFPRAVRERDMRQAVCQIKDTPTGLCFHVAQIWCLVVDNSFLFTYGRMTEETLRGDSIDMAVKSVQEVADARHQSFITVSYKTSVMWSIPVEKCHTWLEFLSHFREFWPQRLLFFRRKRPVTAEYWPRVWNMAKHVNDKIMLEMRIGAPATPPPAGILLSQKEDAPEPSAMPTGSEATAGPSLVSPQTSRPGHKAAPATMSIFSCLVGVLHPEYGAIDEDVLDDHLREVEEFLLSKTSFSDRRAYKDCPEASREEIYSYLEKEGVEIAALKSEQRARQHAYETQIDIANAASTVFALFFPPGVQVPTIQKFWGALKTVVVGVNGSAAIKRGAHGAVAVDYGALSIRSDLRGLCVPIQAFNEIFARSDQSERAKVTVPKELLEAWIHLLMGLIHQPTDFDRSGRLVDDARNLMNSGMAVVVHSLSERPLLDSAVVLPQELLSLLSLKLVQDVTVGMPDISECYSTCLYSMESDIASKASDRSREYRIGLLAEEILAVQRVVGAQRSIFQALLSSAGDLNRSDRPFVVDDTTGRSYIPPRSRALLYYNDRSDPYYASRATRRPAPTGSRLREESGYNYADMTPTAIIMTDESTDFRLSSTDAGGYRVLLLNECLHFLTRREHDFSGFQGWASRLEKVNQNKIDTTKDRHDNAIYAFTIVTIIFLPLSFVASVFGMNTNDVRNMDLNQWAYWATAVPVTVVIIFLGLLWTGELGNIIRWLQSFGQPLSGYKILSDGTAHDNYSYMTASHREEATRRQRPSRLNY